jgi:dolichol kinase
MTGGPAERLFGREVLPVISTRLILIILAIIVGIFTSPHSLPHWAKNVLVSIGIAAVLKLGDCLATLVALSSGKSVERLGNQLAAATPANGEPQPVTG